MENRNDTTKIEQLEDVLHRKVKDFTFDGVLEKDEYGNFKADKSLGFKKRKELASVLRDLRTVEGNPDIIKNFISRFHKKQQNKLGYVFAKDNHLESLVYKQGRLWSDVPAEKRVDASLVELFLQYKGGPQTYAECEHTLLEGLQALDQLFEHGYITHEMHLYQNEVYNFKKYSFPARRRNSFAKFTKPPSDTILREIDANNAKLVSKVKPIYGFATSSSHGSNRSKIGLQTGINKIIICDGDHEFTIGHVTRHECKGLTRLEDRDARMFDYANSFTE